MWQRASWFLIGAGMVLAVMVAPTPAQPPEPTPSPRWRTVYIRVTDAQWEALKLAASDTVPATGSPRDLRGKVETRVNGTCQQWIDEAIDECAITDAQRLQREADYCREHDAPPDCLKQPLPPAGTEQ